MQKSIILFMVVTAIVGMLVTNIETGNVKAEENFNQAKTLSKNQRNISGKVETPRIIKNGVAIEFGVRPLSEHKLDSGLASLSGTRKKLTVSQNIVVGEEVVVDFRVTDAFTGTPVKGLLPDSFLQHKPNAKTLDEVKASIDLCCFRALKRGRMHEGHPSLMENIYVMCLNSFDNSISVINPLMRPKTIVKRLLLGEKCVDLGLQEYGSDLYITCESGKVIVVDCNRLEISGSIEVGQNPYHIEFQPDGRYVWIGNDGDGTVTVIDAKSRSIVKNIQVGKGHHEIAITDDSLFAFVTNSDGDSVTIIDINGLLPINTLKTGRNPHGLVYSSLSQCIYIANEGAGTVSVLDTVRQKIVNAINVGKGVRTFAFNDDGRLCFTVNRMDNSVSVIDISRDKVIKTIPTGVRPESIIVSKKYAYIRNVGSPDVTMIKLEDLTNAGEVSVGELPPNSVNIPQGHLDLGDSYMVIIPNPTDNIVYTIMTGDDHTAFKYKIEGKGPTKVAFFWIGLKEISPGLYTRVVKFDKPGRHEVGFYIDSPEATACFEVNVVSPNH